MPCCGDREKGEVSVEERWEYINLSDFKSSSCGTVVSYVFLYLFLLISIAVYAVDSFTAVNLLVFSRWAGSIKPAIPFKVSRWIFAVCIIISFALLILRWLRAIRAIRSGSIAHSYLDPLAIRIQSIRMGKKGRGWRRFLVFAELTKSKQGAEYVALFAYFSFEPWLNVCLADGPRQVVNAFTLYSVLTTDLLPGGKDAHSHASSPVMQFFNNLQLLANENDRQAVVLVGMLFTLVIWVFSIIRLALAIILYLIFLFHHIPAEDGSLKAYCRRKINSRLKRIVRQKVTKALNEGVALQNRKATDSAPGKIDRKPTLPVLGPDTMDALPSVGLSRTTTQTTLPAYSGPGSAVADSKPQQPTLPDLGWPQEKPPFTRSATQSSGWSDASTLTGNSAVMGYSPLDRTHSPAPPLPPFPAAMTPPPPGARSYTPLSRPPTTQPRIPQNPGPGPGPRSNTPLSRPPTTQPRVMQTPPPMDARGRATPAASYDDGEDPFDPYKEYSATAQEPVAPAQRNGPYRPYSPATDAPARSLTPGVAVSTSADDFPFPRSRNGTPAPPQKAASPPNNHPPRSFTPTLPSATPRPGAGGRPIDNFPLRSGTPTGQSPLSGPSAAADGRPGRSYTPVARSGSPWSAGGSVPSPDNTTNTYRSYNPATPASATPTSPESGGGGYVAFRPPVSTGTPAPRMQTPASNMRDFSRPAPPPIPNDLGHGPSAMTFHGSRNGTPHPRDVLR